MKTIGNIIKTSIRTMSIEHSIKTKLSSNLKTNYLEVINESYMHNVPKDAETHFKVVVVTDTFKNVPLIKRHRMVNDILKEELNTGVHALSIEAFTTEQWDDRKGKKIDPSPKCRGGFGK